MIFNIFKHSDFTIYKTRSIVPMKRYLLFGVPIDTEKDFIHQTLHFCYAINKGKHPLNSKSEGAYLCYKLFPANWGLYLLFPKYVLHF